MGPILLLRRQSPGIMINRPHGRASLPQELSAIGHHLVFAEGTKTELNYAKSIEKGIVEKYFANPSVNRLEIIEVDQKKNGLDTIRLVDYAEAEVKRRVASGEKIDYVWIFFDKDDFPLADFETAIKETDQRNEKDFSERNLNEDPCDSNGTHWTACYSNRCFELWVCLYFGLYQATVSKGADYIDRINRYLKQNGAKFLYEKNIEDLHQKLVSAKGSLKNAICFGKKLNQKNGNKEPSTDVVSFAFYFQNYLKEEKKGE